jgi:hypothetical protein
MTAQGPQGQAPEHEPACSLIVTCIECGEGVEVPLPTDRRAIAILLARRGWFLSVTSPPQHTPILMAALCSPCAQKVYPPEVYKIADERRQLLLQTTQGR